MNNPTSNFPHWTTRYRTIYIIGLPDIRMRVIGLLNTGLLNNRSSPIKNYIGYKIKLVYLYIYIQLIQNVWSDYMADRIINFICLPTVSFPTHTPLRLISYFSFIFLRLPLGDKWQHCQLCKRHTVCQRHRLLMDTCWGTCALASYCTTVYSTVLYCIQLCYTAVYSAVCASCTYIDRTQVYGTIYSSSKLTNYFLRWDVVLIHREKKKLEQWITFFLLRGMSLVHIRLINHGISIKE